MKNIKFVVRVNRDGRDPEYVQRIDRSPIRMTTHRNLALVMARFTAEDAVKSIHNSRRHPELVPVGCVGTPGVEAAASCLDRIARL